MTLLIFNATIEEYKLTRKKYLNSSLPPKYPTTPDEVNKRLEELGLDKEKLILCAHQALTARANTDPLMGKAAPGTNSYYAGSAELKRQFLSEDWKIDDTKNILSIVNVDRGVKVIFCHVDLAGNWHHSPIATHKKGNENQRLCPDNYLPLFEHYIPIQNGPNKNQLQVYYLLVDKNGGCELTALRINDKGHFSSFIERIELSDGSDWNKEMLLDDENLDAINEFDVSIRQKEK